MTSPVSIVSLGVNACPRPLSVEPTLEICAIKPGPPMPCSGKGGAGGSRKIVAKQDVPPGPAGICWVSTQIVELVVRRADAGCGCESSETNVEGLAAVVERREMILAPDAVEIQAAARRLNRPRGSFSRSCPGIVWPNCVTRDRRIENIVRVLQRSQRDRRAPASVLVSGVTCAGSYGCGSFRRDDTASGADRRPIVAAVPRIRIQRLQRRVRIDGTKDLVPDPAREASGTAKRQSDDRGPRLFFATS